jgi:hypothetical protein
MTPLICFSKGVVFMVFPSETGFISINLSLIKELFESNELQLEESITKKLKSKITVDHHGQEVEIVGDFNSLDFDIDEIYEVIMPTYQRQAMIITLWSILEFGTQEAYLFASNRLKTSKSSLKKSDTTSRFKHSLNNLKSLGICNSTTKKFNQSVKFLDQEVRFLRHAWAHNGGQVRSSEVHENIKKNIDGITLKNGQLSISKEYIDRTINEITIFSDELNKSIKENLLN